MEFILKNSYMCVTISSLGAQLIKLVDKDNVSRLHDPSPISWNEVSPILFPMISRFPDKKYKYNHQEYSIGTHGFARFKEFKLIEFKEDLVTLLLEEDEQSLTQYPFRFNLFVTYRLEENVLSVEFKVVNADEKLMYFMLGGHPGFKVPLYENEKYDDYYLKFEKKETVEKTKLNGNYLSNMTEPFLHNQDIINLKYKMFNPDAFVMKNLKSNYIDLLSKNHQKGIRFYFQEFKTLAIWSTLHVDAPFVCLEPWNGLIQNFVEDLEEMKVLELNPNETFECKYQIEVF